MPKIFSDARKQSLYKIIKQHFVKWNYTVYNVKQTNRYLAIG